MNIARQSSSPRGMGDAADAPDQTWGQCPDKPGGRKRGREARRFSGGVTVNLHQIIYLGPQRMGRDGAVAHKTARGGGRRGTAAHRERVCRGFPFYKGRSGEAEKLPASGGERGW